jgi:hypothetical protein
MTVHGDPSGDIDEVRAALASIVDDPDYGADALSSRRTMESLLKDLLPDRPRDAAILVAAAEHGLAASLSERVGQEGMDAGVAVRLVASSFARATAFTPEACQWAATELAGALGMDTSTIPATAPPPSLGPPTPGPPTPGQPTPGQPTLGQPGPGQLPTAQPGLDPRLGQPAPAQLVQSPPQQWVPAQPGPQDRPTAPHAGFATRPPTGQPVTAPSPAPGWPPGYGAPPSAPPSGASARRRTGLIIGAVCLAAALVAVLVIVLNKPAGPVPLLTASASSVPAPAAGRVYVYYRAPGLADATITGTVSRARQGEIAALTAQPFPFTSAPHVIARTPLAGRNQDLSFLVKPSLETRYRIEVLASSGSGSPLATSAARTVYVALIAHAKYTRNSCPRPKCDVTLQLTIPVAPAALRTEEAKRLYFYWGIHLVPSGPEPSDPATLKLQPFTSTAPVTVNSGEYQVSISFNFTVNQDAYKWHWNACTKDDVSGDGIGLPGNYLCGNPTLPSAPTSYIGSMSG